MVSYREGVVHTDFSYKNGGVHTDFSWKMVGCTQIFLIEMAWCTQVFLTNMVGLHADFLIEKVWCTQFFLAKMVGCTQIFLRKMVWCTQIVLTKMVWCTHVFLTCCDAQRFSYKYGVVHTDFCYRDGGLHTCFSYRDGVVHTDFSYKKWWGAHRFFTYTNILYMRVPNRVLYVYKTCFVGVPVPNMFCTCTEHVQNILCIVLTGIVLTVWGLGWFNFFNGPWQTVPRSGLDVKAPWNCHESGMNLRWIWHVGFI